MNQLQILQKWVLESKNIVFFGGAGVSTESGIRDFRGVDGLYSMRFEYPPEEIISPTFLQKNPAYFFRFYKERMMPLGFEPNVTHYKLSQWEKSGKLSCIITQNIDGLHQKAGSDKVCELHGSVLRNYCMQCGRAYSAEFIKNSPEIPRCDCGGIVRPDIVLYPERLNEDTMELAVASVCDCDMLIVGGTSLTVYPAAGLLRYYRGNKLVLINRDETPYDAQADLVIHDSLGTVFSQLP